MLSTILHSVVIWILLQQVILPLGTLFPNYIRPTYKVGSFGCLPHHGVSNSVCDVDFLQGNVYYSLSVLRGVADAATYDVFTFASRVKVFGIHMSNPDKAEHNGGDILVLWMRPF